MKLVLYVNGKKTPYEIDLSTVKNQCKYIKEARIKTEALRLRRIGENSGKDWEVYLIHEGNAKVVAEPDPEPEPARPPSTYSNTSPMGIAKEVNV